MLKRLKKHINENFKNIEGKKINLGVSGGVDSIVLLDLMSKLNLDLTICHCNFNLREEDSNKDEAFVKELAFKYNVPFLSKEFDTKKYMADNKVSVQMAARELRFDWFKELIANNEIVALAHHKDDLIETFFLNLTRGTGIEGLSGMSENKNGIIRPLLIFEKEEMKVYAEENNLEYREDASNATSKYKRNKIRNEILPLFKELNPGFTKTMGRNISYLNEVNLWQKNELTKLKNRLIKEEQGKSKILISEILKSDNKKSLLFGILNEFGFNQFQIQDISNNLHLFETGKCFYSNSHQLNIDREFILIEKKLNSKNGVFIISENIDELNSNYNKFAFKVDTDTTISKDLNNGKFDFDKLSFPLKIRTWEQGDRFKPLGLKGSKLVSDLLVDTKTNLLDKDKVEVLLDAKEEIVWVIGIRISDKFKITQSTRKVFNAELKSKH